MVFWLALLGTVVLLALVTTDVVRGRTRFASQVIFRAASPNRYWAILAFYVAGAVAMALAAGFEASRNLGCDPSANTCVYVLEPVAEQ